MKTKHSEKKYRWSYPHDWLLEKCQASEGKGDTAYLMGVINAIVPTLDADQIQDNFESEMDHDGYFKAVR